MSQFTTWWKGCISFDNATFHSENGTVLVTKIRKTFNSKPCDGAYNVIELWLYHHIVRLVCRGSDKREQAVMKKERTERDREGESVYGIVYSAFTNGRIAQTTTKSCTHIFTALNMKLGAKERERKSSDSIHGSQTYTNTDTIMQYLDRA